MEMAIVVEISSNSSSSVSPQCDQPAGIVRANPPMAMNRVSNVVNCERRCCRRLQTPALCSAAVKMVHFAGRWKATWLAERGAHGARLDG